LQKCVSIETRKTEITIERDALIIERDKLLYERDKLLDERDILTDQRNKLTEDLEKLSKQYIKLQEDIADRHDQDELLKQYKSEINQLEIEITSQNAMIENLELQLKAKP